MSIPWDKLDIPDGLRPMLDPSAPQSLRMSAARGALPGAGLEATLGALYVLACDADAEVRAAAIESLKQFSGIERAINQRTHPKILELLTTLRPEPALDEVILQIRSANDRTALRIAERASAKLCEIIADNHTRLLITPGIAVALHQNPDCPDATLERALAFLRMNNELPDLPGERGGRAAPAAPTRAPLPPPAAPEFDLEAEIAAALEGRASPMLEARQKLTMFNVDNLGAALPGFSFDFKDDDEFGLDLMDEELKADEEVRLSIEKKIRGMSAGKKIKLAFLGNKEVRNILIRDRSKMVASAVVKSGRMTDSEVLANAGNRNLYPEILRDISANKEWLRKYPVQVALVCNPRTPISVSVSLVNRLQEKDLTSLSRNKNVSSILAQMALKIIKDKAR